MIGIGMVHGKCHVLFEAFAINIIFYSQRKLEIGMGQSADTVVCANACLDIQCMRVASLAYLQKKSDMVNKFTLKDIINESLDRYPDPER